MSRGWAIIVGVLTLLPWAYVVLFLAYLIPTFMALPQPAGPSAQQLDQHLWALFRIHFAAVLYTLGLIGFYVVYLFRTDRVPTEKKALWAVVLLLANTFAMPVFWYFYIWRPADASPSTT
jgi:hypothetical protein